ncbi:MAG: sulfatase [Lachnospiraceae bacterium]|nr:sulfatase [Lachnospiraceae bacterium]
MRAIMVMFDTLSRRMLSPYGCDWVKTPNFKRLAEKSVCFDNNYAGSLPCMSARRELHTGRLNFLHRSWGPLEPFDDSMPELLKKNGVYTHLVSDHYHYWEDGGANYHTRYNSWEIIRGQEGDAWHAEVKDPEIPDCVTRKPGALWRNDWVNRSYVKSERDTPQYQTFESGMEFIRRNMSEDKWFLQIEAFDPHEPYFTLEHYKKLYPHNYTGRHFDWPPYMPVTESDEEIVHVRLEHAALVTMCDHYLGQILNMMDEFEMWDNTMLIVNTDHGTLLSEHDWWGKCTAPFYDEVAHTPLFIWDPRCKKKAERRQALVQTIDLAPTLLRYFDVEVPEDVQGMDLSGTIEEDRVVREAGLFGIFGGQVNVTDGRYVYMRAPNEAFGGNPYAGQNLYNYTLMPAHIRGPFSLEEMRTATMAPPFAFTKGVPVMKISGEIKLSGTPEGKKPEFVRYRTELFDLKTDPEQKHPIENPAIEARMIRHMIRLMRENEAPSEQYLRLGLQDYV